VEDRYYIHYVGEAFSFGRRHKDHLLGILSLHYGIFDVAAARRGEDVRLWPGLWREKGQAGPAKLLEAYARLQPQVLEYVAALDLFVAEVHVDKWLRKHLEGSIGWNLRRNHPEAKAIYPDDNRVGTMAAPPGIVLRISADEKIAGLDRELRI
jgi:hypothetical protein